jgi:rod shape-determining protein MreD
MTYLIGLPLLALAAVIQATVLARFPIFGGEIDLVLLLALSWTLIGEWQGGVLWGLMGGLSLDTLSGGPFGATAIGLITVTYLAGLTEGRFWRSHVLLPLATALLGSVLFHLIMLSLLTITGHPLDWVYSLTRLTLPAVLLNTLCMLPVYLLVRLIHNFAHPAPVTI